MSKKYVVTIIAVCAIICLSAMASGRKMPTSEWDKKFMASIEVQVLSKKDDIKIASITDFKWDRGCIEKGDDSEPYGAYDSLRRLKNTPGGIPDFEQVLPREPYQLIFLFFNQGKIIKAEGLWQNEIGSAEQKIFLEKQSRKLINGRCFTSGGGHISVYSRDGVMYAAVYEKGMK